MTKDIAILVVAMIAGIGLYLQNISLKEESGVLARGVATQENLPPDPGEEGNVTVEGVDRNGDRLRDDVERYIALTHPNSEKARRALRQAAVAAQGFLSDSHDREMTIRHIEESASAGACLRYIYNDDLMILEPMMKGLVDALYNIDLRREAFVLATARAEGYVSSDIPESDRKSHCNFDLDLMGS